MGQSRLTLVGIELTLFCLVAAGGLAAQPSGSLPAVNYEGTWASNQVVTDSTYNSTFIRIEKMGNDRFLIISVSTAPGPFTFVAGGFLDANGNLRATLENGATWLYTPAPPWRGLEVITITDLSNQEDFDRFVRIENKFTEWPFPTDPQK